MKLLLFYLFVCSISTSNVCWADANVYDCTWNADGLANLEVGKQSGRTISYRFRADRSEMVYGIRVYFIFRTLGILKS
ncbi:MAG: hypothetical protein E3K37_05000 [Candidatus Kuenenia sp.]|nr:hypothetical protein [Candidatus Kuenenia hertensis]